MRFGVVLPPEEIGVDPIVTRDFLQAAEALGYDFMGMPDHVLGADPTNRSSWQASSSDSVNRPYWTPYTHKDVFHEVLVTLSFAAGVTKTLELFTGVLVLPQRQTALVAKQGATIDVLSGGRLSLGVGIGWNEVEYEALGQEFRTRASRIEEQIAVLRELWTKEVVTFHGRWHHIQEAGINPLPVQRPIPIWMGGASDPVLRRAARLADGWAPVDYSMEDNTRFVKTLHTYLREEGRDPADFGILGRLRVAATPQEHWGERYNGWRALGATHFLVDTRKGGLDTVDDHVRLLERFLKTIPEMEGGA
ncbi:MAG: LLM class F420-dependent oxidoreductase [Deltaproteobacteria bacterium]|nr:LLM class F420-dependent oxidoreductase [Deltaproteobacteria bacterium]